MKTKIISIICVVIFILIATLLGAISILQFNKPTIVIGHVMYWDCIGPGEEEQAAEYNRKAVEENKKFENRAINIRKAAITINILFLILHIAFSIALLCGRGFKFSFHNPLARKRYVLYGILFIVCYCLPYCLILYSISEPLSL